MSGINPFISGRPLILGGIIDIAGAILGAFSDAVFFVFGEVASRIAGPIAEQVGPALLNTLLFTPVPKRGCNAQGNACEVALVTEPTKGVWPEIWDLYWGTFFVAAIAVGAVLYALVHFVSTIPFVNHRYREQIRGGILKMVIALVLGWPVMAISLGIMDGLIHLVAPETRRFVVLMAQIIGALAAAAAGPLAIITAILGLFSITMIALVVAVFIARILYLMMTFAIAPLLIMGVTLRVPFAEGLGKSLFSNFVKIGIAPMFIAGMFRVSTILLTEQTGTKMVNGEEVATYGMRTSGSFLHQGDAGMGNFIALALALAMPVVALGGFYFVMQASMGQGISRGLTAMQRRGPKTSATDVESERIGNAKERYEAKRSRAVDDPAKAGYKGARRQAGRAQQWAGTPSGTGGGNHRARSGAWQTPGDRYGGSAAGAAAGRGRGPNIVAQRNQSLAHALDGGRPPGGGRTPGGARAGGSRRRTSSVGGVLTDGLQDADNEHRSGYSEADVAYRGEDTVVYDAKDDDSDDSDKVIDVSEDQVTDVEYQEVDEEDE